MHLQLVNNGWKSLSRDTPSWNVVSIISNDSAITDPSLSGKPPFKTFLQFFSFSGRFAVAKKFSIPQP